MTKVPSVGYDQLIPALRRDGQVVVRQKGSHIRLHKRTPTEILKLKIPAHRPIKRSTRSHILKHARLSVEDLQRLLQYKLALSSHRCGGDDVLTPPKYAQFLAEMITGARLEIIDGAGHMVMIEKSQEFNSRVMDFLETLGDMRK